MIDYFALLDQPRLPWLDLEKLKETFHRKSLETHPDARPDQSGAEATFAALNEAYQILHDPRKRLQHLLSLEGFVPSSDGTVPKALQELFPLISDLSHQTERLLKKLGAASNDLSRSLLKSEVLELQTKTGKLKGTLQALYDDSVLALKEMNPTWPNNGPLQIERLSNLYHSLGYIARWKAQLEEMHFQLSLH